MKRENHSEIVHKGKIMAAEEATDGGVDELLAALGYKVRASDMADVAQKLEQLDMAMAMSSAAAAATATGGGAGMLSIADDNALFSHLASDTIHYNPSDLSAWLESMLSEINSPSLPPLPQQAAPPAAYASSSSILDTLEVLDAAASSSTAVVDFSRQKISSAENFDLKPVFSTTPQAGALLYGSDQGEIGRDRKRIRSSASSSSSSSRGITGGSGGAKSAAATASAMETSSSVVMVVDAQEAGIRLVHTLLDCAEAVQQENVNVADALLKQLSLLSSSQAGAMRKVADYFAQALARRIYRLLPSNPYSFDSAFADFLHMHFYESCPYLKFAHFTANQAILEAFAGKRRVHVIDFSMKQGMQWPALMQALALRPEGPPSFRLTGIGPPLPDNSDALQQVGWKLAQLADTIHVDFEYRGFVVSSLADLEPYMLINHKQSQQPQQSEPNQAQPKDDDGDDNEEVIAINSIFELHKLLARPGELDEVLNTIKALNPKIVTIAEQESNHNAGTFTERFTEALHYYSTMFDSLEGGGSGSGGGDGAAAEQVIMMTEVYLGREICNVIACEGTDRTERHETLLQWRGRLTRAGFDSVHIGSNAFKQASMLLSVYAGGDGYRVDEKEGCLTLGWHTRPLIATSAWRPSGSASAGIGR